MASLQSSASSRIGEQRQHIVPYGVRTFDWIVRAFEVARQRRALMRLDDGLLKDVGLSRADAYREGTRPWWDLPRS